MRQAKALVSSPSPRPGLEDLGADVEVRRHPGARRLTLRVSRTRRAVIVTLPIQCDLGEAGSFLDRNIDWVRQRLMSMPGPVPFKDGAIVPIRGDAHRVVVHDRRSGVVTTTGAADGDVPLVEVPGGKAHAPRRLRDWLIEQSRQDLERSTAKHARNIGVRPRRIVLRDQTSRWGSCSTTGVLSFSWRLILAPPNVLDYVAAHEVAHLAEMNHGPRFWELVRQTMPAMDAAKEWLRTCGLDLHRYGPRGTQ